MVQAAVVHEWGRTPTYSTIDLPQPTESQARIKVIAAGFHNLVRSRASGKHFSVANRSPPHVPGTDGVGTLVPSGELVYFNCLTAATGSFAQQINVEKKDVFPLPSGADPEDVAVLANPMMGGWMALTARAGLSPDRKEPFTVAIIGATGVSGQAAVQVAKALGASDVVAIGKPGSRLDKTKGLGATRTIVLSDEADYTDAANVDIVIDYLWGSVAEAAITGIIAKRQNVSQRLTWVHIGALAGDEAKISAAVLRKANISFVGSGPGSWTFEELREQLPKMLEAVVNGGFKADFKAEKLDEVESWWGEEGGARKLVKP